MVQGRGLALRPHPDELGVRRVCVGVTAVRGWGWGGHSQVQRVEIRGESWAYLPGAWRHSPPHRIPHFPHSRSPGEETGELGGCWGQHLHNRRPRDCRCCDRPSGPCPLGPTRETSNRMGGGSWRQRGGTHAPGPTTLLGVQTAFLLTALHGAQAEAGRW